MKVLIADPISQEGVKYLQQDTELEVLQQAKLSPEELRTTLAEVEGLIVRSKTQVTNDLIQSASKLRVVGRAGAGVDNIDLEAATKKGVVVMNTPGGNSTSAAEHTLALLLSLARKIPSADPSLRSGRWDKKSFVGQELYGKTLGILGLGKIGAIVADRAHSFQMKVLAYDPFVSQEYTADLGVELRSLEEILSESDFVTLHVPLTEKTRGLICRETLQLMKPGALIVNAARGELIVEEELADALEAGTLGGAALDVFEKEPKINPRLIASDRTVLTPHIAASTVEAQSKVGLDIARQVAAYLKDDIILNAINFPSISRREMEQMQPYLELGRKLGTFLSQISLIRISEIGIRYYGDITKISYQPITNYILKSILKPILSEQINQVNARSYARERGISVVETVSSRQRSYSNLISIQLRSPETTEWIEGAILHQGNLRLVSIDGIPTESALGDHILLIRNQDTPGVIGQVGMILGEAHINIASFVLGRNKEKPLAVAVVNTDGKIPDEVIERIRGIDSVESAERIQL